MVTQLPASMLLVLPSAPFTWRMLVDVSPGFEREIHLRIGNDVGRITVLVAGANGLHLGHAYRCQRLGGRGGIVAAGQNEKKPTDNHNGVYPSSRALGFHGYSSPNAFWKSARADQKESKAC